MADLSPRHKLFAREYLKDFNQYQAAVRAGYSPTTAASKASKLIRKPPFKKYMVTLIDRFEVDTTVDVARVVKELARIAFCDVSSFYHRDENGKLKPKQLEELSPDQTAALSSYNHQTGTFKFYSKESALEKLGKYLKIFSDEEAQQSTFVIMPKFKVNGEVFEFNVGQPAPMIDAKLINKD